jgi:UDP-3-O-[3-hydroxymyristoyl] glucosamine N-acyltransferase
MVDLTEIGNNVEVQFNSVVGKSVFSFQATNIGDYSILGSFVDFGHGSVCGKRNFTVNNTKIAGSCTIGNDCWIAGSMISSLVNIGVGAHITMGSVVFTDVKLGQTVTGNPAVDHKFFLRNFARLQSK